MAYVRWSSPGKPHPYDSQLYIFEALNGGIECCGCPLIPDEEGFSFEAYDHNEMIDHVRKHIEAGHAVPDFVIPRLEHDRDQEKE